MIRFLKFMRRFNLCLVPLELALALAKTDWHALLLAAFFLVTALWSIPVMIHELERTT